MLDEADLGDGSGGDLVVTGYRLLEADRVHMFGAQILYAHVYI
jgi:hypothetical protein